MFVEYQLATRALATYRRLHFDRRERDPFLIRLLLRRRAVHMYAVSDTTARVLSAEVCMMDGRLGRASVRSTACDARCQRVSADRCFAGVFDLAPPRRLGGGGEPSLRPYPEAESSPLALSLASHLSMCPRSCCLVSPTTLGDCWLTVGSVRRAAVRRPAFSLLEGR